METQGIISVITILLTVVDKVLAKMPDYDQRKKEEFYKLKEIYETEKIKDPLSRDDNIISSTHLKLMRFIHVFADSI